MKTLSYVIHKNNPKAQTIVSIFFSSESGLQNKAVVRLELVLKERVSPDFTLCSFYADYCWTLNNGCCIENMKVYGGVCEFEGEKKQRTMYRKARECLADDLEKLKKIEVSLLFSEESFGNWESLFSF